MSVSLVPAVKLVTQSPSSTSAVIRADDCVTVGGILSSRATRAELADQMVQDTRDARSGTLPLPKIVIASNGQVIARYHQDAVFRQFIRDADIIDIDGMPLVMATRVLCRRPLRERVATTDFVRDACAAAAREGVRFFFLGAMPGRARTAAENLVADYPGLAIAGTRHGYFDLDEEEEICRQIVASGTDVLWLGLGTPKQEEFAFRNRERLAGVAWIRTCGGLFDFYCEHVPRAPQWVQDIGFEWLYRIKQEPRRLGMRYLMTNPAALYHLLTKTHD